MPQTYQNILSLVKDTHEEFTAKFSVHEPTTPLNGVPITDDTSALPSNKDVIPKCLGKEALHEICLEKGNYSWTVY